MVRKKQIVIFGAGDIARLAKFYFDTDSDMEVAAFTANREYCVTDLFCDLPLLSFENIQNSHPPDKYDMFIGLSYANMNKLRASIAGQAKEMGYSLASYISSRCTYLSQYPAGENCFILEDNTIQPFVKIGNNVTLWSGNHIGHDSVIDDNCFITSHVVVSGHVRVKRNAFIGVNATLRNSITIGEECIVGAGAIIMKDTEDRSVYLPERAKKFGKTSDQIRL